MVVGTYLDSGEQVSKNEMTCTLQCFLCLFRNILELGSGSGLVGVSVARLCRPATLTLTDRVENVMQQLKENVKLNLSESAIVVHEYMIVWNCSVYVLPTSERVGVGTLVVCRRNLGLIT